MTIYRFVTIICDIHVIAWFAPDRRRVEFDLVEDPEIEISDDDLVTLIQQIRIDAPYTGVQMMWGSLRQRGIKITRERLRVVLRSIDPFSGARRWPSALIRRQPYSVPGPNSLWHIGFYNTNVINSNCIIDSHHKLVRWRIVTHGGIDGYSRLVVYLDCSNNNCSTTVYQLFLNAVSHYQLPSRVRSDQGLESLLVARHMIESRGSEQNSMITGSSTHNQRIERLWKDLHQSTIVMYYKLFYFMEHNRIARSS